jgi:YesN/AraC family two-component response regulator
MGGDTVVKLAEALAERSDCQNRLEDLKKRMVRSARVQEGEKPAENSEELMKEAERLFARLLELISAINRTNAKTAFDQRRSISDAIAERDVTGKKRDLLSAIADAASTRQDRYSKSEVKFVSTFSVAQIQNQVDQLSKEFRELDTRLQELNWQTELV